MSSPMGFLFNTPAIALHPCHWPPDPWVRSEPGRLSSHHVCLLASGRWYLQHVCPTSAVFWSSTEAGLVVLTRISLFACPTSRGQAVVCLFARSTESTSRRRVRRGERGKDTYYYASSQFWWPDYDALDSDSKISCLELLHMPCWYFDNPQGKLKATINI